MMFKNVFAIAVAATIFMTSCGSDEANVSVEKINSTGETELGLIKSTLTDDEANLLGNMPEYSAAAPGTAEKIERAFENAPPMIPHMTTGFLPITIDNNICLTCHMPDKAEAVKAVPLPQSHFTNLRPEVIKVGGLYKVNAKEGEVTKKDMGGKLNSAYFNCSQCHVPQANVTVDIKNTFERVFRDKESGSKSNLVDQITEGI